MYCSSCCTNITKQECIPVGRLLTVSQHAMCRGVYPSMHWAAVGCVSKHALGRGCLHWGVSAQELGVCPGLCLPRGVSAWGCGRTPPRQDQRHEQNNWQMPVKILPCHNFVVGGNKLTRKHASMMCTNRLVTICVSTIRC